MQKGNHFMEEGIKRIGIVTGATGGMGREFVRILLGEDVDEVWMIGRNQERLEGLREQYGKRTVPLCLDLTDARELEGISKRFTQDRDNPIRVSYLVNNAGMAHMIPTRDFSRDEIGKTIRLNCQAPAVLTNDCLPFMGRGSRIINVSSASAFQPVPHINLYAATKAFELSYSRALHRELAPYGITVTAVCPGWVDTELLERERNGTRIKFPGMVTPERVAEQAVRDAKKGRDMSVCSLYTKCQRLNVKLLPHSLVMRIWLGGIRKYL